MRNFLIISTCFVLFYISYCLLPTLFYRHIKKPPFALTEDKKVLMLSFDDGPDPRYTDKLLHILKDNGITAAFFVVAEKAAEYPDILKNIKSAGHFIGLHSLEHRDAWLTGPFYQKKEFERSLAILKNLGCNISYYRAPWGHLNILSLLLAKKHKLKILSWSVMAQDWEKSSTADRIVGRLLKRSKSGSVICLHDSGCGKRAAPDAPEHTLQAVSVFIPLMRKNGFRFVLPGDCVR